MVELMNHLTFIERESVLRSLIQKEAAIGVHHEHEHERRSPSVAFLHGLRLVHQNRHVAVNLLRQFRVSLAAEGRTRAGIRIDETEILRREMEPAAFVGNLMRLREEERKFGGFGSSDSEKAELQR